MPIMIRATDALTLEAIMCTCSICGKEYEYNKRKGHTKTKCGSCQCNHRRFELKRKAVEYLGGGCSVCGYNKCIQALEFHHRDETTKEFCISGSHSISWVRFKAELDKCDLLCSNCHRETHHLHIGEA